MTMRQVVLDTETTGLEVEAGHRVIEIGCVELINRRPTQKAFHRYVNPERAVEAGALEVHGIDDEFLSTQPKFADIVEEFLDFVSGSELIIHNADFDVQFINHELGRLGKPSSVIEERCRILDTLGVARRMHPGQRNSLDALAKRYGVDNSKRELHGALLDARILADVYLAMTGGQASLSLEGQEQQGSSGGGLQPRPVGRDGIELVVVRASAEERNEHEALLRRIREYRGGAARWDSFRRETDESRAPAEPPVVD
jgi:DNA polymerase-3 subunit epsilon